MNRLLIFLNELSCSSADPITPDVLLTCVLRTLETLRAVRRVRRDLLLASEVPISGIPLGDGTQFLATVLRGPAYKDEWRFLTSLDQSSPWGAYPGAIAPGDLEEVNCRGRVAVGMTWARQNDSAVFSFGHLPHWNAQLILAESDRMDELGNIDSQPIEIRNLSAPEHVETHREMIRNYGGIVSPSSMIHEAGAFVVRMYTFDHNPPHFHVLLSDGTQAKLAINTLDVLAGNLPPGLLREVRSWAEIHQNELRQNWERCRIGDRPFVIEE